MTASTKKYFGTDGIRGKVGGDTINAAFALRLGYAAGSVVKRAWSSHGTRPSVLIGKDTRISGYMLESALQAGLSAAGVDVMLAGPVPTPAVAYLARAQRQALGIVISASHNPFDDNGIKFFSGQGTKLPADQEAAIEAALDEPVGCVSSEKLGKARRLNDAAGRYIEFCKATFPSELDLNGLTIVVDAANGAAYQIAPNVFRELGATVIAMGCEPNGININDQVGATQPQALAAKVQAHRADFGIALDGDADRLIMVGPDGRIYDGDELLYVIVRDRLRTGPVAGVAGTLMTNFAFERGMAELGVPFVRTAVGDKYVVAALQENGWLFGGENSGHILCLDRHSTGDGIIAALQVSAAIIRNRSTLTELTAALRLLPQKMISVRVQDSSPWESHVALVRAYQEVSQTLEGRGRVLIRASGTEPKLRLMVEADEEVLAMACVNKLAASLDLGR